MSDIDLDDIRRVDGGLLVVFRELMRQRQTTAAAERLGLSQSAISHALGRLRDVFGDPLFTRKPHGLEPTRRALELAPRVDTLIDLVAQAVGRKRGFDPARSARQFLLSAPEFVTALIGANLVRIFRDKAPRASFTADSLSRDDALRALRRGELDAAIGRFEAQLPGLSCEPLFEDRYCVVARRNHPKIRGRISEKAWLTTGHVFAFSPTDENPDEHGSAGDILYTAAVPRWLTALAMVAASDAIATCPMKLARRQAKILDLQVITAPFLKDRIRVSVAWRVGAIDPGTEWFLAQLRGAVR